ncbi:hypothetical protein [Micromonospora sp. NPDC005172]|uniref:hypothetical protein n=1 Tax=Micromonospora sp. NPDC005172 TaxID=3156867 RepID=UPI0033BBA8AA
MGTKCVAPLFTIRATDRGKVFAVLAAVVIGLLLTWGPTREAHAAPAPTATADKFYVVGDPVDGRREFLFAIAAQTLGDGKRYREIFELNRGRAQPDGRVMDDPTVLEPGWILLLPADARGPGVRTGPLPSVAPASTPPSPAAPDSSADAGPRTDEGGMSPILLVTLTALLLAALAVPLLVLRTRGAPTSAGPSRRAIGGRRDRTARTSTDTPAAVGVVSVPRASTMESAAAPPVTTRPSAAPVASTAPPPDQDARPPAATRPAPAPVDGPGAPLVPRMSDPTSCAVPTSATPPASTTEPRRPPLSAAPAAEPSTAEPSTAKPSAAPPQTIEPSPAESRAAEPRATVPGDAEPPAEKPEAPEPRTAEPVPTEPLPAQPQLTEPMPAEPLPAEPLPVAAERPGPQRIGPPEPTSAPSPTATARLVAPRPLSPAPTVAPQPVTPLTPTTSPTRVSPPIAAARPTPVPEPRQPADDAPLVPVGPSAPPDEPPPIGVGQAADPQTPAPVVEGLRRAIVLPAGDLQRVAGIGSLAATMPGWFPPLVADLDTGTATTTVRLVGARPARWGSAYGWLEDGWNPPPSSIPVVLGERDGRRLWVDLAAAPDVLTLGGDPDASRRLGARLLTQLAPAVDVVVIGDALGAEPLPERARRLTSLDELARLDPAPLRVVFCPATSVEALWRERRSLTPVGHRTVPVVIGAAPAARWSVRAMAEGLAT